MEKKNELLNKDTLQLLAELMGRQKIGKITTLRLLNKVINTIIKRMEKESKDDVLKSLLSGATISNSVIVGVAESGSQVFFRSQEDDTQQHAVVSPKQVSEALKKCGDYVWGNSAYAVVFCVCRDCCGWQNNASLFERAMEEQGVLMPPGTINAALSRNPYMKLSVEKWDENGAMMRVLKLRDAFEQIIENMTDEEPKGL